MTTVKDLLGATRRTTTIIREGASTTSSRLVVDGAATLSLRAFPFASIAKVTAGGALGGAGVYLLTGFDAAGSKLAYAGASGTLRRRLQEHAGDPANDFASEVFVLAADHRPLDKNDALHVELRLMQLVEGAGAATLLNEMRPCTPDLPEWRKAELDRMLADALPLFFDAGCHILEPGPTAAPSVAAPANEPLTVETPVLDGEDGDDADEGSPIQIGVTTVPIGVEEQALSYGNLFARGYEHEGQFVVAAGSEMRATANNSANEHTVARRERLIETGAVAPIPNIDDRMRLRVAVAFRSRAIAAKVLTGAHAGSDAWRPLRAPAPVIVAA